MKPQYRPSTLAERKEFYKKEFSIQKVKRFFEGRELPQICAIDAGSETGIILNKKLKGSMLYLPFNKLEEKIKKYIPEDIYYDRSTYANPDKILKSLNFKNWVSQELVFDIDADNIKCDHPKKFSVCDKCLSFAYAWTKKMERELKKEFKKVKIVYSGRGFHIHILDKKAYSLTIKEREKLNKKFSKYPIDPWVSRGHIKLIRMPHTLNSLVSRKVIPLKNKFIKEKTIPNFLKT